MLRCVSDNLKFEILHFIYEVLLSIITSSTMANTIPAFCWFWVLIPNLTVSLIYLQVMAAVCEFYFITIISMNHVAKLRNVKS
jgi:hypothetical protein